MRQIKFKAWNTDYKKPIFEYFTLDTISEYPYLLDKEIMQYTGLKDKNGTEIYEGDVINKGTHKYRTKERQIIYYDVEKGRYIQLPIQLLDDTRQIDRDYGDGVTAKKMKSVEVIGNIYENPELLQDAR